MSVARVLAWRNEGEGRWAWCGRRACRPCSGTLGKLHAEILARPEGAWTIPTEVLAKPGDSGGFQCEANATASLPRACRKSPKM